MNKNSKYGIFNEVSFLNEGVIGLSMLVGILSVPTIVESGIKISCYLHDAKRSRLIEKFIKNKIDDKNLNDIENKFGRVKKVEFAKLYEELNDKKLVDTRFRYSNVECCAS